jgi:hypothetical protein
MLVNPIRIRITIPYNLFKKLANKASEDGLRA